MSQNTNEDEIPSPVPLGEKTSESRERLLSAPELDKLNKSASTARSDARSIDPSSSRNPPENPLISRFRAQTALASSSRRIGVASLRGARSFRTTTGVVADLFIPSFKTTWTKEINESEAGRARSIAAFVTAFLLTLGFSFLFFTSFTQLDPYYGAAERTFENLSGLEEFSAPLFIGGGGGIFFYVVFDFYFATNKLVKGFGFLVLIGAIISIILGTMFLTVENVTAPILLLFLLVPILLVAVKTLIFKKVNNRWYLLAVAIALMIVSIVTMGGFLVWFFTEEAFFTDEAIEEQYFGIVGCNFTVTAVNGTREDCPQAFLVYVFPLVISVYSFVFSNILTFTIRAQDRKRNEKTGKPIEPLAQIFILTTILGIIGTWVTASLFAAEVAEVDGEVLYLSLIAIVTVVLIVFSVFDVKVIKEKLLGSPLGVKVVQLSESEWIDAFAVFLLLPLIGIYFALSFVTQSVRRFTPLGKKLEEEDEKNWAFTKESQSTVKRMQAWDLGSLLTKVLSLGVIWFVFVIIIGRVVNVFLSVLSEFLGGFSLPAASFIFIGTGLALFALPPVPGLPIYLTGGILLSQNAKNEGFNFAASGAYAIFICSIVKMLSIVMQQKIIGQTLGRKSVAIRSACQLNSLELRAMKKIMSVPGLSAPKVAVLVGGPDWPTSVLTGLMGLPVLQMMLGSIPVLFTIIPVCYAGAVLVEGEDSPLAPLNAILLSVSLVVQLCPFFVAIHYIAKAAIDHAEELENEPLDQEVLEYEAKNKEKKEWQILLTRWKNFSCFGKCCHIFFSGLMIIANMAFTFAGEANFESFDVTDTIADRLDGNVFNLLKPFGYIMMSLFGAAFAYSILFGKVQGQRVKRRIKNNEVIPAAERPDVDDGGFASLQYYSTRFMASRNVRRIQYDDDELSVDETSKRSRENYKMSPVSPSPSTGNKLEEVL